MGLPTEKANINRYSDLDISDLGRPDTLRYNILSMVINEEYERAINALKDFLNTESEYPNFRSKVERYSMHAIDLIYAIRTKRNFPGVNALTRTKQQELKEKFKEHFSELRIILKKMEHCLEELRLNDVKSTRILVKAVWLSTLTVFIAAIFIEIYQGVGRAAIVVAEEGADNFMSWIFSLIF